MLTMNTALYVSEYGGEIEIAAPAGSDFFIDPMTGVEKHDAPFCYEKRKGDFAIRARVKPDFRKTYDAGGLFVYDTARKWIKLEFEKTESGCPSVVSVVTSGSSDCCNGERPGGEEVNLQILRRGDQWALHYSPDGKRWNMVRYFRLKMKEQVRVGIVAQSPLGRGCTVTFSGLVISENRVKDIRKGK